MGMDLHHCKSLLPTCEVELRSPPNDNSNPQQGSETTRLASIFSSTQQENMMGSSYGDNRRFNDDAKVPLRPYEKMAAKSSAVEGSQRTSRTHPYKRDCRKIFVGGLPPTLTDAEFHEAFTEYGSILDSVVMIDKTTKRSRGFGFVTFADVQVAQAVLDWECTHAGKPIPPGGCRSGHVYIKNKLCEVKTAEPKDNVMTPALVATSSSSSSSKTQPYICDSMSSISSTPSVVGFHTTHDGTIVSKSVDGKSNRAGICPPVSEGSNYPNTWFTEDGPFHIFHHPTTLYPYHAHQASYPIFYPTMETYYPTILPLPLAFDHAGNVGYGNPLLLSSTITSSSDLSISQNECIHGMNMADIHQHCWKNPKESVSSCMHPYSNTVTNMSCPSYYYTPICVDPMIPIADHEDLTMKRFHSSTQECPESDIKVRNPNHPAKVVMVVVQGMDESKDSNELFSCPKEQPE